MSNEYPTGHGGFQLSQNIVMPLDPVLLRPSDVAALLQLSRSHVYELIASGAIPSLRVGRAIRIRRQDLDHWVNKQGAA